MKRKYFNGYAVYWRRHPRKVCPHCGKKTFVYSPEMKCRRCYLCEYGNIYGFHRSEECEVCQNLREKESNDSD